MKELFKNNFETKIGTIKTWIEAINDDELLRRNNQNYEVKGYRLSLQTFELRSDFLPEVMRFKTSIVWRWFIKKTSSDYNELAIFCKLNEPSTGCIYDVASGEHLDAIEIENESYHLHIGTEDSEVLKYRAANSDWMPVRFKDELSCYKSFTSYIDFGFKITVPILNVTEKIYFHFIVATNPIKQSIDYPDERDVSTWYAVDRSKAALDEYLNNSGNIFS